MPRDLFSAQKPAGEEKESSQSQKAQQLVASPEIETPTPAIDDEHQKSPGMETLTRSGPDPASAGTVTGRETGNNEFTIHASDEPVNFQHLRDNRSGSTQGGGLNPYVQTLSIRDLESCLALETAIFPPEERASKERVSIRSYNASSK